MVVVVALTIVIFKKIADRWRRIEHYKSRMFINMDPLTDPQRRLQLVIRDVRGGAISAM